MDFSDSMFDDTNSEDVINYHYIDYIIRSYVPDIMKDSRFTRRIRLNLFRIAMTHPSFQLEYGPPSYERLEFLGDAIYHIIVTIMLYNRYPLENIGFLTKTRIKLERGATMAFLCEELELDRYIQVFQTIMNVHILEDVFEAFIGAFYLNYGFAHTCTLVISLIEKHIDMAVLIATDDNYKDILLQYFHKMKWGYPKYYVDVKRITTTGNIADAQINYSIVVKNPKGKVLGKASNCNKRIAEQIASKKALEYLGLFTNGKISSDWLKKIDEIAEKINSSESNLSNTQIRKKAALKKKDTENSVLIHNVNNVLLKKADLIKIFKSYGISYPTNCKVNQRLFTEAMTHKSYVRKTSLKYSSGNKVIAKKCIPLQSKSNDRLQFLGDAVIHAVLGAYMYEIYPDSDEGFMTRLRCKLENKESLYFLSKKVGLQKYILLSNSIDVIHKNRSNVNIVGGGLEAFVGALFLQHGFALSQMFFLKVLTTEYDINEVAENETNYKDLIGQYYSKSGIGHPVYHILKEEGPDHSKKFTMGIVYDGKIVAKGSGQSRRKGEQLAAKMLYNKIMTTGSF